MELSQRNGDIPGESKISNLGIPESFIAISMSPWGSGMCFTMDGICSHRPQSGRIHAQSPSAWRAGCLLRRSTASRLCISGRSRLFPYIWKTFLDITLDYLYSKIVVAAVKQVGDRGNFARLVSGGVPRSAIVMLFFFDNS